MPEAGSNAAATMRRGGASGDSGAVMPRPARLAGGMQPMHMCGTVAWSSRIGAVWPEWCIAIIVGAGASWHGALANAGKAKAAKSNARISRANTDPLYDSSRRMASR